MTAMGAITRNPILVVGYGNQARRDDGIGPYIAAELDAEGFEAIACHQLFPELAVDMCDAERVIFVDAGCEPILRGWRVERIEAQERRPFGMHALKPCELVGMAAELYDHRLKAWLITVQGDDFSFGFEISPVGSIRAIQAMGWLKIFLKKIEIKTRHRSARLLRPHPLGGAHAA